TLFIPLSLAAFGIVLRGSGFAFQKLAPKVGGRRLSEYLFGLSSVLTPFFMGTVVGAIASGRVPVGNASGDLVTSWLNPLSLLVRGARRGARVLAVGAVVGVVWGWGVGQFPYLLPEKLTISGGAAPSDTLTAVLVVFGAAVVLVLPAIALLYALSQRSILLEGESESPGR